MKELTIEDKAKRYDEVIEELRGLLECIHEDKCNIMEKDIIKIFPELKESEDERINEWLINLVKSHIEWLEDRIREQLSNGQVYGDELVKAKNSLAWLEKQGEISDKIVERARTEKQRILVTESDGVANIDWDTRSLQDVKLLLKYGLDYIKKLEKQGEQKPADNKDYSAPLDIEIPFGAKDSELIQETIRIPDGCYAFIEGNEIVIKKGEKPAWSEEDKAMVEDIIEAIDTQYAVTDYNEMVNWLKSLKDRYTWKPSYEQMQYLSWIANVKLGNGVVEQEVSKHLNELLEDLKKLREG